MSIKQRLARIEATLPAPPPEPTLIRIVHKVLDADGGVGDVIVNEVIIGGLKQPSGNTASVSG